MYNALQVSKDCTWNTGNNCLFSIWRYSSNPKNFYCTKCNSLNNNFKQVPKCAKVSCLYLWYYDCLLIARIYVYRPLLKVILGVLGLIVIEKENSAPKNSKVLVSNYLSLFDHIALHLATGAFTVCIFIKLPIIICFI